MQSQPANFKGTIESVTEATLSVSLAETNKLSLGRSTSHPTPRSRSPALRKQSFLRKGLPF